METSSEAIVDVCVYTAMENIRKLDEKQLQELLRDEMAIKCIAKGLPELCNLAKKKEDDEAEVKTLDTWKQLQEQKISKLQDEMDANGQKAAKVKEEVELLQKKLDNMSVGLDVIARQFQTATITADEEGEILTKLFLVGKISADEFVKQFHEKRTLVHLRKIKTERLLTIVGTEKLPLSIYPKLPAI